MLRRYQIALNGFYQGTDITNGLVKVIAAENDEAVAAFVRQYGLEDIIQDGPLYLQGHDHDGDVKDLFSASGGIDILLKRNGSVKRWAKSLNLRWAATWQDEAWPQPFVAEAALTEAKSQLSDDDKANPPTDDELTTRAHKRLAKRFGYRRSKRK